MLRKKIVSLRVGIKSGVLSAAWLILFTPLWAQPADTGTIRGQVLNESTGSYLNTARVSVQRTEIETFSNNIGEYWLTNVPAGEVTIVTTYVGMAPQSATITVVAGRTIVQNFTVQAVEDSPGQDGRGKTVKLEPLSVTATALSAQAVAATTKRNAGNIKDVIALDEFADKADGNIGEFIKYVPGLDIQYNPFSPSSVTIRGMPASGTLVQFDGVPTAPASAGNTRSFDLNTAANANIERIEVTKAPTPDMPANAVGGSINVISKSGFSRVKPLFTYNLYTTYNAIEGEFDPSLSKAAGPDELSAKAPVGLAYDLSYILPLSKKLAFTFALTRAPRLNEVEYRSPGWNKNTGILNNYQFNELLSYVDLRTGKGTVDWRITDQSTLQVSFHKTDRRSMTRQHFNQFTPGVGATGDANSIQGAVTGVGQVAQNLSGNQQYRSMDLGSVKYRYDGAAWKLDAFASMSKGGFKIKDLDDGFFGTAATSYTGLVVGATGLSNLDGRGIPAITVTRAGVAVDPWDGSHNSINTVTSAASVVSNEVASYGVNLGREFDFAVPTTVKLGFYNETMKRDNTGGIKTWTFTPPGGAATRVASLYNVFADEFSRRAPQTDTHGKAVYSRYLSMAKLRDLYLQNPAWFVLNDAAAHTNLVNASINLKETVTAAYLRLDNKFLNNKLWLVYGARYERTVDDGSGPLNDIGATYQRDAAGKFIRNSSGQLVKITTNALANAQLQYKLRGSRKQTAYDGLYPSLNASYSISDRLVLRTAYAKTIARPDLGLVIPSVIVTDPNLAIDTRRITVVDGTLKPWTSDSYDLTFEAYDFKNATASVSFFQKDLKDFFVDSESPVTPAELAELNLPADYSDYFIHRTRNGGKATLRGVEFSYRQSLQFIPIVGRHLQAFFNLSTTSLSGQNPEDFAEFSPHNFGAGVSYVHGRVVAKLDMTHNGLVRRSVSAASATQVANAFNWRQSADRFDFSLQFRLTKRFSPTMRGAI